MLFALIAVVSWWMVIEDGPSPARLIAAIVTSVGAVIQVTVRGRAARRAVGRPADR